MTSMLHLSSRMTQAQKGKILRPTDVWSNRGVSGIQRNDLDSVAGKLRGRNR